MDYNSTRSKLVLPEYGRHIQKMVAHAVAIEDREERTRCANAIIGIMGNLFPHLRDVSDFKHKLWDHIAIMSDFKLDIDYPYEIPAPEKLMERPEKVPYQSNKMTFAHYGELIEEMIVKAINMENPEEKKRLIFLIASHMKKSLHSWNRDSAVDERVFRDIERLSKGQLKIDASEYKLPEIKDNFQARSHNNPRHTNNNNKKRHHTNKRPRN